MFKRIKPQEDIVGRIGQFPHCDQRVLHAPGECEYCDRHPEWQALRKAWGIAFTGHSNDVEVYTDFSGKVIRKKLLVCPSEVDRSYEVINRWPGNRPKKDVYATISQDMMNLLSANGYTHWKDFGFR